ncbi:MAG: DUF305 domain-containing protein [Actinomycetota bacterium]|nr:DUF305 domain-containing protein [Actinomycetota bacterium]
MFRRLLVGGAFAALAIALIAGCGGDDDADEAAVETDGAFIVEMTAHHESAIEMAEIAEERAQRPQIRELATDIIATQSEEIDELEALHQALFAEPVAEGDHGTLGLEPHEAGMEMDARELESAKPFERAFIDMMVPHHQGAIRMARVQLDKGQNPQIHDLAQAIIDAQSREIEAMNAWRERWYGAPSPAGGIPPEGEEEAPAHETMGH